MPDRFCPACGTPIRPFDSYCRQCGTALNAQPEIADFPPSQESPSINMSKFGKPFQLIRWIFFAWVASLMYVILGESVESLFKLEMPYRPEVLSLAMLVALVFLGFSVWRKYKKQTIIALIAVGLLAMIGFSVWLVTRNQATKQQLVNLSNPDAGIRSQAAEALGELGAKQAVEALLTAMQDAEPGVRSHAAYALGAIGDLRALETLIAALQDQDEMVRMGAAFALGEIKDTRALAPLIAAMWRCCSLSQSSAAYALGEIGKAGLLPLMEALTKGEGNMQEAAAVALGRMGAPAIDSLAGLLDESDQRLRFLAASALDLADSRRSDNILRQSYTSADLAILAGAHEFYIEEGQPGTEPQLISALSSYGDEEMATDYLNCGNVQLHDAAINWAAANGYTLVSLPGPGYGVSWGK